MPDDGRTHEEEAHAAVSADPGHARAAAGDRRLHAHHRSVQVAQAQVGRDPLALLQFHFFFPFL